VEQRWIVVREAARNVIFLPKSAKKTAKPEAA